MTHKALLKSGQAPDLQLARLRLWIHGREFPESADFWDGNWLRASAQVTAPGSSVAICGSFVRTSELRTWLAEIEQLHTSLAGQAELPTIEPALKVVIRALEQGHIALEVEVTPDQLNQEHTFHFDLDQSYLPSLAFASRRLLKQYPVIGTEP